MSARALLAAAALALLGCGGPARGDAYLRAMADARRSHHDGRFDDAAARFDDAARSARQPRDAVYARYEAALARARAGDVARAATELRAIAAARPPTAYSAQAAFKAAELARASDEDRGLKDLEAVALAFPESGVAAVALGHLLDHDDQGAAASALARLDRLLPRLRGTALEERAAYERARRLETLAQAAHAPPALAAARDAYLDVAARWPYPFGSLNDDALYRAAELEVALSRPREAIAVFERLLAQREVSAFLGSYERPRYLPAALRVAELYEATLNDRPSARAALHRVYKDFSTSTMRDDALWREAELWRLDGDTPTACARLATLTGDFPDSRYVPCAALRCPSLPRPKSTRAPSSCHAYLVREPSSTSEAARAAE
jgi:outer membrane protein assembly factor BamD (BamD/ComL family)